MSVSRVGIDQLTIDLRPENGTLSHMRRFAFIAFVFGVGFTWLRAETVQIDCGAILNARPVSVVENGRVVPWTVGIDGGGKADGFATMSAAQAQGDSSEHALPDDGKFAANADHPLVQLPYGLVGARQPQGASMSGAASWDLRLREAAYRRLFLFFTSAEGASQLTIVLHYRDGTSDTRVIEMPDYYRAPGPADHALFALAANLGKWNAAGKMAEADHHYIDGWRIGPDPSRVLRSITLSKGAAGYVVFWGATGETAR